jgi:UDP-N-acetylglucosamine 2-epimerase
VPVLVLRETTERPEAVAAGAARVVGTDPERIVAVVYELLDDPATHARMAAAVSPYGDGRASDQIVAALLARA